MKKILVPLATGFEEIEAVTVVDILRRAGARVVTAGLEQRNVTGSHGIQLVADCVLAEAAGERWDLIVLPGGGPGTERLAADARVLALLHEQTSAGRPAAAICAAPFVLQQAGVTAGRQITIHPAWAERITTATVANTPVQTDGTLVTGRSAGAALEFAFALVRLLYGDAKVAEINAGVLAAS